ncbi:OLC1v1034224C1 [Oldenlandia corymbosa var. corymbosa]|uniref:OLC1v1034224C1 n=1 Tax=Oldenlandia corymbosa var. corymbosa TaxID=529605 RepID=A0AAV1CRE3_OLDCO|nr:OLC1v1034224C1 [Oldenlandia corymbosa var. corymbosa]
MKKGIIASCCSMATQSSSESDQEPVKLTARRKINESDHRPADETIRETRNEVLEKHQSSLAGVVSPSRKENVRTKTEDHQAAGLPVTTSEEVTGRERLKRHRVEVAGQVWIPEMWGQEGLLKDWIDCGVFDAAVVNTSIMSARAALVEEGRKAHSTRLRIENSC